MILSSPVAYFLDLNSKFWIFYFFYFMFNRFKPPNNPLKPQARTRGNRSSFSGELDLTFWLCGLDRVTTLSPNPPIPAHYPPLVSLIFVFLSLVYVRVGYYSYKAIVYGDQRLLLLLFVWEWNKDKHHTTWWMVTVDGNYRQFPFPGCK